MENVTRDDLVRVRAWAQEKIAQGSEPPWAWFQYMKLVETIQALEAGMDAVTTRGSSPQSAERSGAYLRLVGSTDRQDDVRHHPVGLPVQMPT
jgi:hypothetical protein